MLSNYIHIYTYKQKYISSISYNIISKTCNNRNRIYYMEYITHHVIIDTKSEIRAVKRLKRLKKELKRLKEEENKFIFLII